MIRKLLLSLLLVLPLCGWAEKKTMLVVELESGATDCYRLADKPLVTFGTKDMTLKCNGIETTYAIKAVKDWHFTEVEQGNEDDILKGDLNEDGKVSVADYNKLVRMIVTGDDVYDPAQRRYVAADVDCDTRITVSDIPALISILTGIIPDKVPAKSPAVGSMGDNSISFAWTGSAEARQMAVNLINANEFTAAQFDLVLPQGLKIANVRTAERTSLLELYTHDLGNNHFRVLLSSLEQNPIEAGEGAILYCDVEGQASDPAITFANAIAADKNATSYALAENDSQATGINVAFEQNTLAVSGLDIRNITITSLSGQRLKTIEGNAANIDLSAYPTGVYLVTINKANSKQTLKIVRK